MGISNFSIFSKFLAKDGVSPVFSTMTKSSKKFDDRMNTGINRTKAGLLSLKTALQGIAVGLAAVATAVPVKSFADWEKGINNVYGLMSKSEIDTFGKKVEELSKNAIRVGLPIEDVNKALFDTISAMGVSEKSFDTYNQALVLAKGGNTDLSTAVSGLTAIMNAWGQANTDATSAANAMFTAQKYGVTTVGELAGSIGQIAPTARAAGVSMEETLATMAALTKGGMATADATTALRATMTAFIKPSKEASEVLQKYGIASDLVQLRQQGLATTLSKLIKLQKQHPAEIAKAIPNIRALNGVLSMNEERMQDVEKILTSVQADLKNGTGLQEAFERMDSGDAATWAKVMGEINIAMIELGKLVSPILIPLAKGFTQIIQALEEFLPKLSPVVSFIIKLGEGLKTALNYLKPLQVLLPVVTGLLTGLAVYKAVQFFQMMRVQAALFGMVLKSQMVPQILASIPAIWAQTAAFLANPIFWIPAAIAAVVTALVLLWKHRDKVTAKAKEWADWLTGSTMGKIVSCIFPVVGIVALLIKHWEKIKTTIISWWESTKTTLTEFWAKCKSIFGAIGSFIKEHFVDILLGALGPVGMIINTVRRLPEVLKALGLKTDAFEIKTDNGDKNPKQNPQVKGGKQKGEIEVKTTIDNRTNLKAQTNTSLQGSNNLQLKPAN